MSTSEALKQLPGLDNAPDVYATPDPDHDGDATESSIAPTSPSATGRRGGSGSDTSHDDDGDDSEDSQTHGVSRRRLYPDRARSKFDAQSRGIETRGVDLSDRVDGKRKGFTTVKKTRRSSRRGRGGEVETLEAKIARLKREVEECRLEARAEEDQEAAQQENEGETKDAIEALSRLMSGLDSVPSGMKKKGHARTRSAYHDAPTIPPSSTTTEQQQEQDQQPTDQTTLTNITAFDSRLAAIESALGLSSLDSTTELSSLTSPLLPTIALLDHQVATLTSATSLSALEAASTRIHKLKTEAAELSNLQSQQPPQSSTPASDVDEEDDSSSEAERPTIPTPATLSPSDLKTLQSLYTLLPTLQSLSPLIPALTSRLRSLRTIHTAAFTAHTDLDGLEERQGEMEKELRMWREGLERVEEAVEGAEEQNEVNGKFVRGWVEELEGRVRELKR